MNPSMKGGADSGYGDITNSLKGNRPCYKRLTSTQNQLEKENNNALRVENDGIRYENILIRNMLDNVLCPSCGGPPCQEEEYPEYIQRMRLKNENLRVKYKKVHALLKRYLENQISRSEFHALLTAIIGPSSYTPTLGSSLDQAIDDEVLGLDLVFASLFENGDIPMMSDTLSMQKALMVEIATIAMNELVKLIHINKPLWIKSSAWDGKFILSRENYEKTFSRTSHFKGPSVRVESSKSSTILRMSGKDLVEMFLNPEKWANIFPTIVTKAETIQEVETGLLETRSGALKLMYGKLHMLSPLVPAREFCFLRYCQHVGVGEWIIMDVSFDPLGDNKYDFRCWKHPSGCKIQEIHNDYSMVTWIEHVEVDDKAQAHHLYRDIVNSSFAYGAERWIKELQRMCERITLWCVDMIPSQDAGGVINSLEGRRSVMNLSHRMIKMFSEDLIISVKPDFQHLTGENNSEVMVALRKCTKLGQPHGIVVIAITSFWLPLPYQQVFEFLTDDNKRFQWDVLCNGNPVNKIARISNGVHPDNCTSIIKPFVPSENMLILQESFIDPMGSYVVYAPMDEMALDMAIHGENSILIPVLPSGFIISRDDKSNASSRISKDEDGDERLGGGSLLTMALQVLVSSLPRIKDLETGSISRVNDLLTSRIKKIKDALNCNNVE
ncbi:hypothetical protein RIF29_41026 [Crotalaria pallida]|uniref:START domain-containing protein n=1 Tax=Crotalaria pallida TaxID=3830 RepID=A0AAN9HR79_CROPI